MIKNILTRKGHFLEIILVIVFLLGLDLLMSFRYAFKIEPLYYILTIASIAILPSLIALIPHNKTRYILNSILLFIALVLFVTDTCLFFYKEDIFTWAMLFDIGDGLTMGLKYNIFVAFPFWAWILIFGVFIAVVILLRYLTLNQNKGSFKFYKLAYIGLSIFLILSSGLYIREADRNLYQVPQDKRTYLRTFGFSTFNQKDAFKTIEILLLKTQTKINAASMLKNLGEEEALNSSLFATQEGKNVIMIMTETAEQYAMDPQLTPTLYNLYHNSYYFTNTYGAAKTNYTYDAEFKSLTSMMYYNNDNLMHSYDDNTFNNSLPSLLKSKGYSVNSFHSYYSNFFNRIKMHQALGFESSYFYEDMTFSPTDYWPLDSEFFTQNLDLIVPLQDKPFFSFLITLSTHGDFRSLRSEFAPYYAAITEDGRYLNYEDEFINLLAAQMDLDLALERLINDLRAKDLLNDTLIVMYSDHKNYSSLEITKKYTPLQNESEVYNYEYDIVPFVIYNPTIETREITYLSSQYDIMPTVCDLLGIKLKKDYVYGQSIFLYDDHQYEDKPIILGYNRWISKDLIVYDKEIVYISPSISDQDAYFLNMQNEVSQTITRFHAFFITDYFATYLP